MLTIYDRQKMKVGSMQTSGPFTEAYDVAINRRLNSDYVLTFFISMDSKKYPLLEKEGLIECEGEKYVIKKFGRKRQGMGRTVQIVCQHIMRRMMDIRIPYSSAIVESFGTNITALTDIISAATGGVFTFQIMGSFPLKDVTKWGYSNCLKAFQDLVNLYEVEFIPDNYNIKLYSKINIDQGMQYRFAKNIIDDSFETNTDTLCTRMTGLAKDSLTIIDLPASYLTTDEYNRLNAISGAIVGGLIKVPYLVSQYASAWATPDNAYFDNEFEANDIDASTEEGKVLLLEQIRKELAKAEVPEIQVQVTAADLWKNKATELRPQLGETVYLIDDPMELDNLTARIMEMTEYPFDPSKNTPVTLANYILKDYNDIIADLNASKRQLDDILTNKKVNTSKFELFARQAIHDIDNSKTEVIYDNRGIVLKSTVNPLHMVVESSEGIYLTKDGGSSDIRTAITADGIAAPYIVGILGDFAQIRADRIIVGDAGALISDSLIAGAANWNGKTTLITPAGIYTGQVTTDQLIAGTAKIGSALIDKITASQIDVTGGRIVASQIDATSLQVAAANITGQLTASQINATNLQVAAANITGQLTASQINATNLQVAAANITGTLTAGQINTANLAAEKIYQSGSSNNYAIMGGSWGDLALYYNNNEYFRVYNSTSGIQLKVSGNNILSADSFGNSLPKGTWNFSGATVTNLNIPAKFA